VGWILPLDPTVRVIHMGDINELGYIVAGAFAHPDEAGNGQYLPLVGDFMSFNKIVETLNRQGHNLSYKQVPKETFAGSFPGATEIAETFSYWEAHTLPRLGFVRSNCSRKQSSSREPTRFQPGLGRIFPYSPTPLAAYYPEIGKAFETIARKREMKIVTLMHAFTGLIFVKAASSSATSWKYLLTLRRSS